MTEADILKLDTKELTEEQARVHSIDYVKEEIDLAKASLKRNGLIAAVMTAAVVATGMNDAVSYGLMGADSVFLIQVFEKTYSIFKKKKVLKQFEQDNFEGSYIVFLEKCQDYIAKKYPEFDRTSGIKR